jgi:DNA-binding NtrC family response regulator
VTAYASSDSAKAARAAGAWQILSKPVNIGRLLNLVNEALDTPLVLVVDDDRDLCENLWDLMRERGFRVHLAHDVADAERAVQHHNFQVVLIDMKLPSGDGSQVLRLLRQKEPQARTVIITGFASEMETRVQQALAAGANAVCYKPFDVDKLLGTVQDLCEPKAT